MRVGLIAILAAAVAAPAGWTISDRLESRNEFCVSCHLSEGVPLHEQKMSEFSTPPARNLAAAHYRAEAGFRCIDCHGGASFPNKLRVKTVAARDLSRWLVGWFDEPTHMKHPLWDEDCAICHPAYPAQHPEDFHALADHNIDFAYRCVECHRAHPSGGVTDPYFVDREVVLPVCRNCHEEF